MESINLNPDAAHSDPDPVKTDPILDPYPVFSIQVLLVFRYLGTCLIPNITLENLPLSFSNILKWMVVLL